MAQMTRITAPSDRNPGAPFRCLKALALVVLAHTAPALHAEDSLISPPGAVTLKLVLDNHRFKPDVLHAPVGKPIVIELDNRDDTVEEFESHHLRKEVGVRAHQVLRFLVKPQLEGRYPFQGEFHASTAKGFLVVP